MAMLVVLYSWRCFDRWLGDRNTKTVLPVFFLLLWLLNFKDRTKRVWFTYDSRLSTRMASHLKSRSCAWHLVVAVAIHLLFCPQEVHSQSAEFGPIAVPVVFDELQPAGTTVALIDVTTYGSDAEGGASVSGGVFSIPTDGDAQYFRIASSSTETGATGNLTSAVVFDGKVPPQLVFTFTVTFIAPDGITSASTGVTIQLQRVNQPPRFANRTYDVRLPEKTPGGTIFLTVTATDPNPVELESVIDELTGQSELKYVDTSGLVTYSIVGGDARNMFAVDPQSGDLSLTPQADLGIASGSEYNLTVTATDGGGLTDSAVVRLHVVAINAHSPIITSPRYASATIPEDTPLGYVVLSGINATDADSGSNGQIRYLISSGDVTGSFGIDESTGELTVSSPLSWIVASTVTLTILAQDGGTPPLSDAMEVDVTVLRIYNYPPVFSQPSYVASVQENLPAGAEVLQVAAYEPIAENVLTYSIVNGSRGSFAIDPMSGLITTNVTVSRALTPSFNLTVMAVDNYVNLSLRLSALVTVYVEITSSNDHPPQWARSAYHMDTFGVPDRTDIGVMTATTRNEGPAAVMTYSFSSLDPTRPYAFRIYPTTGLVRTNESISFDKQEYYYYTVRAQDSSKIPQYADVPLTIQVRTTNLFPPMFSVHSVNITLVQNVTVGTVVLNQTAVDWDTGVNGMVRYRILTLFDQAAGSFDVHATNGQVYVNTSLNYGLK